MADVKQMADVDVLEDVKEMDDVKEPDVTVVVDDVRPVEVARPRRDALAPIFVDLGKRRAKHLKQLQQREGPLVGELNGVIEQVRAELAGELDGKTLVPLVIIYRKKARRRPLMEP